MNAKINKKKCLSHLNCHHECMECTYGAIDFLMGDKKNDWDNTGLDEECCEQSCNEGDCDQECIDLCPFGCISFVNKKKKRKIISYEEYQKKMDLMVLNAQIDNIRYLKKYNEKEKSILKDMIKATYDDKKILIYNNKNTNTNMVIREIEGPCQCDENNYCEDYYFFDNKSEYYLSQYRTDAKADLKYLHRDKTIILIYDYKTIILSNLLKTYGEEAYTFFEIKDK